MEQFSLSVVLPVGNLASSLAAAVAECQTVAARHTSDYEIIIADDASTDGTGELADRLADIHPAVAVIHYPRRRGYRQVLYDTWGVARGTYVVALALAGPAAATDISRLLPSAPAHAAIFGYRVSPPRHPAERLFITAVSARAPGMCDPAMGLGLFRADMRDLLTPNGPDALTHADLYAAARRHDLSRTQIAVPGKATRTAPPSLRDILAAMAERNAATSPLTRAQQNVTRGAGILIAAAGIWLLRRLGRHP